MNNRTVCYERINIKKRGIFKKKKIHCKKIGNRKANMNVERLKKRKKRKIWPTNEIKKNSHWNYE